MIYSDFHGEKLSALGLGCMRLPLIDGDDSRVDQEKTNEMVAYAMEHGVNYYDTAWGYHAGNSELAVGNALKSYPRESFKLADKFPGYDLSNMDKVKEIFEEQLKKCQVEYFDFYLFHNVCEMNIEQYLDPKYGIFDYLIEQKKNGRIRHLGFSAHGEMPVLEKFIGKYGEYMEFGQLQINWLDWTFQNAAGKVKLYSEHNIPVWVMEPVRGGKLADLPEKYVEALKKLRHEATPAEWAFRFLQTVPEVKVTLSGMSNFEQLKENIAVYEEAKPLSDKEKTTLAAVAAEMISSGTVPCTACHYCTTHCPQGLDIPNLLELYNEHKLSGGGFIAPMALGAVPQDKQPSACIGCRSCEAVCPQQIKISEALADFNKML
ncbi:MAG: oxidoreductase [Ruminococcaceae bacterium]|nr:oxidoreductase [Oscillospiraceae bacterium]